MTELLGVEKAGLENIKAHIQAADELKKECNVALTVLLAGAAAALGYAAKELESAATRHIGLSALSLSISLFVLCGATLYFCLKVSDMPAPTNEPRNLMLKDVDLESMRVAELNRLQERIDNAKDRNRATAYWLNRIRVLAVLSPLVPFVSWAYLTVVGPS